MKPGEVLFPLSELTKRVSPIQALLPAKSQNSLFQNMSKQ